MWGMNDNFEKEIEHQIRQSAALGQVVVIPFGTGDRFTAKRSATGGNVSDSGDDLKNDILCHSAKNGP